MKKVKTIISNVCGTKMKFTQINYATIRTLTVLTVLLFATSPAFAIGAKLTGWQTEVDTAMTTLVAIYAVVGGFLVFVQYMQGSQEAQKNLIKFVIGLAVFGVAKILTVTFAP